MGKNNNNINAGGFGLPNTYREAKKKNVGSKFLSLWERCRDPRSDGEGFIIKRISLLIQNMFRYIVFILAFIGINLHSQVFYSDFVRNARTTTKKILVVQDGDQTDGSDTKYLKRSSIVKLKYVGDRNSESSYYNTWTYQVAFKIMNNNDTTEYENDTMKIAYGPNPADCKFLETKEYTHNWKKIKLRILKICATSGGSTTCLQAPQTYPFLPPDIELELSLKSTRVTQMSNTNGNIQSIGKGSASSLGISNQAQISIDCDMFQEYLGWPIVPTANEYELEWVYISDDVYDFAYSTTQPFNQVATSQADYQHAFTLAEPVRITTMNNYYPYPSEYPDHGHLYYRIRPVGKLINVPLNDYDQPAFYPWSTVVNIDKRDVSFPDDKNWQRITTFAEEGKFKKVISYYDGLYRSRQSLTHMTSDNNTIIAETLYDHEGRGTIQMLPYPEKCTDLTYKPNRRKDINGADWNKYDFELTENPSNPGNPSNDNKKLQTSVGSSRYYSSANPFIDPSLVEEKDLFTADAELFPFTEVEFMMDGTGRVSRTSGVGPNHLLGSGHETKYFYSTPLQQELTRLFGSNVGHENHYKKNYVVDANGQVSTSYMDQEGRVIATALVGNSPESLIEIPGASVETLTVDLSDKNQLKPDNSTEIVFNQFNALPGSPYIFTYKVPYEYFSLLSGSICLACTYTFDVRIEGPGINYTYTENINPTVPLDCEADGSGFTWTDTLIFPSIGDYTIYKKLSWDKEAALSNISTTLIANSGTVFNEILQSYYALIDPNDCDPFLQNAGNTYGGDPFSAVADMECQGMLHEMMNQVSPGGYYFEDSDPGVPVVYPDPNPYNGSTVDDLFTMIYAAYGTSSTVNGESILMELRLADNSLVSQANASDRNYLLANWRFEWGEIIAKNIHPEICHYDQCMWYAKPYTISSSTAVDESNSSNIYDLKMTQDVSISEQYVDIKRYMNPQGNTLFHPYMTNPFPPNQVFSTPSIDPWPLNIIGTGATEQANLRSSLNVYHDYLGQDYSIWEWSYPYNPLAVAGINGHNGNLSLYGPSYNLGSTTAENETWNIYRGSYLQGKTNYRYDATRLAAINYEGHGCPILNIPERVFDGNQPGGLTLPENENDISTITTMVITELDSTVDHVGSLLTDEGDLCYESCENKANLILGNILQPCLSLYEIETYLTFNTGETLATNIQADVDAFMLNMINYCMANCDPPLAYGIITTSELANISSSTNTDLQGVYTALGDLQTDLIAAGFPDCSSCPGCSSLTDLTHIEESGDTNNTLGMVTGESCVNVSCLTLGTLNDPGFNSTTFINGILNGSSTFSITGAPLNAACTYCGCLPSGSTSSNGSGTNYYPSATCIGLSQDCDGFSSANCSSLYTVTGPNTSNSSFNVGSDVYYLYPESLTTCNTNCNIKMYTVANNQPSGIEIPISVVDYVSNIGTWVQTGPGTFFTIGDPTFNSPYSLSRYQVGGINKIAIQIDLTGCGTELVCTPETLYTLDTDVDFNYTTWQEDCMDQLYEIAYNQALTQFNAWIEQQTNLLLNNFQAACIQPDVESMTMTYQVKEHHYTLYYYDQADNLVQTVPPLGVHPVPASNFVYNPSTNHVVWNGTEPHHGLETVYQYNSLNQPVEQTTPDGGYSLFYYDNKGRITHSQNEKQRTAIVVTPSGTSNSIINAPFSRTVYDELGRIKQVSERKISFIGVTNINYNDFPMEEGSPYVAGTGVNTELENNPVCSCYVDAQITRTYYEVGNVIPSMQFKAENTRARVAFSTFQEFDGPAYDVGTHYSYDIHGNVKTMVNEYNHLIHFANNRYKRTDYKYDLISGKVNQVQYQPGRTDKFVHKYTYDADNRLTRVETSSDYTFFETDAKYFYSAHGPLSRMEIGERKVQAADYAYTIHGWLKGVNAGFLNEEYDMGKDGYNTSGSNLNKFIARDAYGYVLDYYEGDYKAAGEGAANYKEFRAAMPAGSGSIHDALYTSGSSLSTGLYNGNIVRMHTALSSSDFPNDTVPNCTPPVNLQTIPNRKWEVNGSVFHYDQLNRIKKSIVYEVANMAGVRSYGTGAASPKYGTEYTYDANGNITRLKRNGNVPVSGSNYLIDDMHYAYVNGNNQLSQLKDSATEANGANKCNFEYDYDNDITTGTHTYTYDEIGNLKTDPVEGVQEIKWSVYGKVREVIFSNTKPDLEFVYDASGQRVMKIVKTKTGTTIKPKEDWIYTLYSRDAQGNILSIYTIKKNAGNVIQMNQEEVPIYGSARLGVYNANKKIVTASCAPEPQYSKTNVSTITTCQAEALAIPPNPHLVGTNPGFSGYVYYNQNINTFQISDYQVGTSGETTAENMNISTAVINSITIFKIKYVPVIGNKQYELTDHLGNVLVTVNDVKKGVDGDMDGTVDHYEAIIQTTTDYYPFGMPMPGRYTTALTCSTSTTTITQTPVNDQFTAAGTTSLTGTPSSSTFGWYEMSTATNAIITGNEMTVDKGSGSGVIGVAKKFPVVYGKEYSISFDYDLGACNTGVKLRFQVINASTSAIVYTSAQISPSATGYNTYTVNNIFTATITGNYIIQFYREGSVSSICTTKFDNIIFTYQDQTNVTSCFDGESYAFGFNGQLKDNDLYGEGNGYTAEYWEYDPRLGRRWNIDPATGAYAYQSPYACFNDNPILFADPLGLEGEPPTEGQKKELARIEKKWDRIQKWNSTHDSHKFLSKRETAHYNKWHNWDYNEGGLGGHKLDNGGYWSVEWEGSLMQQAYENLKKTEPGSTVWYNGNKLVIPDKWKYNSGYLDLGLFMHQQQNMAEGYFLMAKILEVEAGLLAFGCFSSGGVMGVMENQVAVNIAGRTAVLTQAPLVINSSANVADDAVLYASYWTNYAPKQIAPGTTRIDWLRISGRTGRFENSRVIYDQFGRQTYRVDLSNHMRPNVHSTTHLHQYEYSNFHSMGKETVFNFW